ncbi:MAG: alpha/beta fold hydrolase [Humibacillus sp.]|nr:alpha/beta fold hydrolase [Humibacillus sp.]MDN5779739.1 alpha/beta fold hydrolase [Humibacillus sp.]
MSEHAAAFVDALDALGLADAHLCGHSFGALVALELAAGQHRNRVRSLVLP